MSSWPYSYCPHQAFAKNLQLRLAAIPYTFVPDATIDAFTNVNVKCADLSKRNIPTLAYQRFETEDPQTQTDTNFAKDYYKEVKDMDSIKFDNNIVEETKAEMNNRSAYVLASHETDLYNQFEAGRRQSLENARRRAASTLRLHAQNKKDHKIQNNIQNSEWLKKQYRKLEQIANIIIEGEGQSLEQKEKIFLLSKSSLTAGFLSKIKVRNPQSAFDILSDLRTLMLKKKMKFENQRQEQDKNKSVTMSFTTDVSQNTSQGSFLSEATSINTSNIDGEEKIVSKYCDFEALSKKWGISEVEQVRNILRLILTRKFVSEGELNAVKKKKEAQKINDQLEKLNPELSKKLKAQKQNKQKKKTENRSKRAQSTKVIPQKVEPKGNSKEVPLNKQDLAIKENLLKGGQFDAIGQRFARNRNFSSLFKTRQKQLLVQFQIKKDEEKPTPSKKSPKDKLDSTLKL